MIILTCGDCSFFKPHQLRDESEINMNGVYIKIKIRNGGLCKSIVKESPNTTRSDSPNCKLYRKVLK